MGLLSKLKLPQPKGGGQPPEASPAPDEKPSGGFGSAAKKAIETIRKGAEGASNPPPKKGGLGGAAEKVAASVQLAIRVQQAEQQMNAALAAANNVGNPLDNRTAAMPESPARKVWQAGMLKYWQPGSSARTLALSLQGEARIAKAQEATALLAQARAVFQQGLQSLG
ncbi:MAG: hypothetical protein ABW220_11690 [Burkholderiaceae bacterium]